MVRGGQKRGSISMAVVVAVVVAMVGETQGNGTYFNPLAEQYILFIPFFDKGLCIDVINI